MGPRFLASLLLAIALPAAAQEVRLATRLPRATLLELAARPDVAESSREVRHEKRPRRVAPRFETAGAHRDAVSTAATIEAPPVVAGFAAASSNRVSPADASGAVGPSHVVGAFNTGIVVQSRTGQVLAQLTLAQFWADQTSEATYDPRIAYDAELDRWVTIAISEEHLLMIAVSQTGDPTGSWLRYALELNPQGGNPIDFSRLALTRDTIVAVTERAEFASCLIVSTQKADLYAGGATVPVKVYDTNASASQVVPVASPDSDVEWLMHAEFVGSVSVKRLDDAQWKNITSPTTWDPGWFFAKQLGTSNELDFGFDEVQNAVFRGGVIYAAQTIGIPGSRNRTGVMWWKIDPVGLAVRDQGVIDDGAAYYGYPSVAVNRSGAMLIGYSVASRLEYPSSRYVFLGPAGHVSNEAAVKDGDTSIRNTDRWGDYTTTVVDPRDDSKFWTVQVYANDQKWGTWWAAVKTPAATNRRRSARH